MISTPVPITGASAARSGWKAREPGASAFVNSRLAGKRRSSAWTRRSSWRSNDLSLLAARAAMSTAIRPARAKLSSPRSLETTLRASCRFMRSSAHRRNECRAAAGGPCRRTMRGVASDARAGPQRVSHQRFIAGFLAQRRRGVRAIRLRAANQGLPQRTARSEKAPHAARPTRLSGEARVGALARTTPVRRDRLFSPSTRRRLRACAFDNERSHAQLPTSDHPSPLALPLGRSWSAANPSPKQAPGPSRRSSSAWPSFAQPPNVDSDSRRHP